MSATQVVYHFTDTAHLPWILKDRVLKPGANRSGGYPDPDFVWATINERGDRSSSSIAGSAQRDALRRGYSYLVRITCRSEDFSPWQEEWRRHPAWTEADAKRLETHGCEMGSRPADWYCRVAPLPLEQTLAIATKGYRDSHWRPFERAESRMLTAPDGILGVVIAGNVFSSKRFIAPTGQTGYAMFPPQAFT